MACLPGKGAERPCDCTRVIIREVELLILGQSIISTHPSRRRPQSFRNPHTIVKCGHHPVRAELDRGVEGLNGAGRTDSLDPCTALPISGRPNLDRLGPM